MKLQGDRLYLRRVLLTDAEELWQYQERNRAFFTPYRPKWPDERYTLDGVRKRLERLMQKWDNDEWYDFHIFSQESDELIGSVGLMFVRRGPAQCALLGYELDEAHNGKGLMTEAVRLCVGFGFEQANLHRIEASVSARNTASNRLLEKIGFTREGLNRKNVQINGEWEDHYLWAMLDEDWKQVTRSGTDRS